MIAGTEAPDLLKGPSPRVFGIPPQVPFTRSLVTVLRQLPSDVLAGTTIFLPSRRACLALREAFLSDRSEEALLLPRMRSVGDIDMDGDIGDHRGTVIDIEPIDAVERVLLLSRLIRAERDVTDEQSVRLAKELARFLDELQTEEIALDRLEAIVPDELSQHWQSVLGFLKILTDQWPQALATAGLIDPVIWRNHQIRSEIELLEKHPPSHPVIVAGVTGSVPMVAELMATVAGTDQGCVILPGFDPTLPIKDWGDLPATHPYAGIERLLVKLGISASAIAPWPETSKGSTADARARFALDIFRDSFANMRDEAFRQRSAVAAASMVVEETPDLATEATTIALRLRQCLKEDEKTALLVTSDRNLARRVAAELRRWDVEIDDSAGIPLDQSPPGSLLLLTAHAIVAKADPVALLAALKHPLARGGRTLHEFRRLVRKLELMVLRGPRIEGGLAALVQALRAIDAKNGLSPGHAQNVIEMMSGLAADAAPFAELTSRSSVAFKDLLQAHLAFLATLTRDAEGSSAEFWSQEAGEALARFIDNLRAVAATAGTIDPQGYPAILAVLMMDQAVRTNRARERRLAILGQFEARLQHADLVIIGGLNEGVWPRNPSPNPWLNRSMRETLGLPDQDLKISAAAHDFLCLMTAPEVVLSRSQKDFNGSPNSASRWLARIKALLAIDGSTSAFSVPSDYVAWSGELDRPQGAYPRPCPAPAPRPPRPARPTELSVTDIEKLARDPYSVYAEKILGLEPLEPLDADPGAAERGLIIHRVLERFVSTFPVTLPDRAEDVLIAFGRDAFAELADRPQVEALWWPRFETIATWFVEIERDRRKQIERVYAEVRGELTFDVDRRTYRIRARADRIEVGIGGNLNLLDYKTGTVPAAAQVRDGVSPQLPLEAAIAQAHGFKLDGQGRLGELLHVGLAGGSDGGLLRDPTLSRNQLVIAPDELGKQARKWLENLVRFFDDPSTPYFAVPHPEIAPRYNPFEHLERLAEWRGTHG